MAVHSPVHTVMPIAVPIAVPIIMHTATRMQTKLEEPIIVNGRPTYRSIPSRRSGFRPVRAAVRRACAVCAQCP